MIKKFIEHLKDYSSTYILTSIFVVIPLFFLILDGFNAIREIQNKIDDKRYLQEQYEYLDTHSVWTALEEMYSYAESHHICNDDECDFWDFEKYCLEVYGYCEAASYISNAHSNQVGGFQRETHKRFLKRLFHGNAPQRQAL